MKELEKLESMKRFNSQKALKDDFVESNRSIINSNMQRRNKESMNKQSDKYDYFPFVSGDLIEQHQANLGVELKNDLQNYLNHKKNQSKSNFRNTPMKDPFKNDVIPH